MTFANLVVCLKPTCPFLLRLLVQQLWTTNLRSGSWFVQQEDNSTCFPNNISRPSSLPPPSPLKASARLFGRLYEAPMCEAALWGKAKQTGWPGDKESATQRHVAAKPSQSTSPNPPSNPTPPFSHDSEALTLLLEPHKPFHTLSLEPREGAMEEEGEQILIPIQWMSPPHKGDRMTLPLNQS